MKQDTYYEYLDGLRDSGLINMFGAAKYLEREFPELEKMKEITAGEKKAKKQATAKAKKEAIAKGEME